MSESLDKPEFVSFNDYFVKTWLENPIFSTIWSAYGERHKTNNTVESWNNHFRRFSHPKPNIVFFLEAIKKDCNFFLRKLNDKTLAISKKNKKQKTLISE